MKTGAFPRAPWLDVEERFPVSHRSCGIAPQAVMPHIRMDELLDEAGCSRYLDRLSAVLGAPSRAVTASQFAKRYAAVMVVPYLYAVSVHSCAIDLQAGPVWLECADGGEQGRWAPRVYYPRLRALVPEAEALGAPAPQRVDPQEARRQRAAWLAACGSQLFAGHLAPLWRTMSRAASVSRAILWENTAVRIYSLYGKKLADAGFAGREQAAADFEFWMQEAGASLFMERLNPLNRFSGEIRKTCCLYYQVSKTQEFCQACPKEKSMR